MHPESDCCYIGGDVVESKGVSVLTVDGSWKLSPGWVFVTDFKIEILFEESGLIDQSVDMFLENGFDDEDGDKEEEQEANGGAN